MSSSHSQDFRLLPSAVPPVWARPKIHSRGSGLRHLPLTRLHRSRRVCSLTAYSAADSSLLFRLKFLAKPTVPRGFLLSQLQLLSSPQSPGRKPLQALQVGRIPCWTTIDTRGCHRIRIKSGHDHSACFVVVKIHRPRLRTKMVRKAQK